MSPRHTLDYSFELPSLSQVRTGTIALIVGLFAADVSSAQNSLNVAVRCLSFQLQPTASSIAGYGTVTTYFSTYDGRDDIVPLNTVNGSLRYYSGEMRPTGGGAFATDYISYSSIYGALEDGYIVGNFPTTDSDGNGVPDFLQLENSVSFTISASQTAVYPTRVTVPMTLTVTRSAGQVLGTYRYSKSTSSGTGTWSIAHNGGTCSYTRGQPNQLNLALSSASFTGVVTTGSGSSTSTVNSVNQVTLPVLTVNWSNGKTTTTASSTTLTRTGNRYRGPLTVVDGLSETSWQDFTQWIVEATDTNDSNGNGIPDWSDTPSNPLLSVAYALNSKTLTLTGQPSHEYTAYYSTNLTNWQVVANLNPSGSTNRASFNHSVSHPRGYYRVTFP